ncbi:YtzI protein [Peribacillus saganii]|uniref:YtzI protein n=1 Tax=Peribacillus saganii TaxID=2303992 RepID=A0A372LCE1_9BACI|nr:YtzI protein [Peribacillus saganii]RFU63655.1 YtzI protein [Peribacillus saganii]
MMTVMIISIIIVLIVLLLSVLTIGKAYKFEHTVDKIDAPPSDISNDTQPGEK